MEALPDLAGRSGHAYQAAPRERIERYVVAVRAAGARYVFHDSPSFPELLHAVDSPPLILTVRGDAALAERPCVAVVGARNASAAAINLARDFSTALAGEGFTVISGFAREIDGAAHEGAFPPRSG